MEDTWITGELEVVGDKNWRSWRHSRSHTEGAGAAAGAYQHLQVLIVCDPNKKTFSVALGAKGVHFLKESWMCFAENLYPDHRTSSNQSHSTGMGLPFGES